MDIITNKSEAYELIKDKKEIDMSKFKVVMVELQSIGKEYSNKLFQLQIFAEKEVVRKEYSKGGSTMHRGFYCPSFLYECIIDEIKRGRLLKKEPHSGKYTYEYGFDKDDKLIRIKRATEYKDRFHEEYLIYFSETIVYSFEFDNLGDLSLVSKCTYSDGNIIKYERVIYSEFNDIDDLYSEKHRYENNKLSEIDVYSNFILKSDVYTKMRYIVDMDDRDNIIRLVGGEIVNDEWKKSVYTCSQIKSFLK